MVWRFQRKYGSKYRFRLSIHFDFGSFRIRISYTIEQYGLPCMEGRIQVPGVPTSSEWTKRVYQTSYNQIRIPQILVTIIKSSSPLKHKGIIVLLLSYY